MAPYLYSQNYYSLFSASCDSPFFRKSFKELFTLRLLCVSTVRILLRLPLTVTSIDEREFAERGDILQYSLLGII